MSNYSPPRGGWDCREFTDPFSNLPPAFSDDAPSTSFFSPFVDGDGNNGETETQRRQRRQRRRDLIASQDSDAVPETPQTNEKSAFEEDDVDDESD